MKRKSFFLGAALAFASSLSFAAVLPAKAVDNQGSELILQPTVGVEAKIAPKAETVVSNCFPVSFQSDCLYISGTWCGNLNDLMQIVDQFLESECP